MDDEVEKLRGPLVDALKAVFERFPEDMAILLVLCEVELLCEGRFCFAEAQMTDVGDDVEGFIKLLQSDESVAH